MRLFCWKSGESACRNKNARMTVLKIPVKCGPKELIANIDLSESSADESASKKDAAREENDSLVKPDGKAPANNDQGDSIPWSNSALKTVGDLRKFIAEEVNGDSSKLKIIFRGKFIGNDINQPLKQFNFKESDKLMVMNVPKQVLREDSAGFKALLDYEKKHLLALNKLYDKNGEDMTQLERNFLEGNILKEMIQRMEKQLHLFTEICMRHLEAIDSIPISDESTREEQLQRNREKRKSLVNGIQELLNKNDKYLFRLSQYAFKTEHPDQGH
uniref:BAG family molecular chaperone regulator 1 n=1 Tax=Ditylenchus dipsaci TaxID=166011 RepID=A0A915DIW2_9BILA